MSNIAILGHPTRGKEVIEILEMFGGKNHFNLDGAMDNYYYYIDENSNKIYHCLSINLEYGIVYTLEEFEEKFPYKVGDKVKCWINGYCSINNIKDIQWDGIVNEIKYRIQDYWYSTINLQPYKEETMKEIKSIDLNKLEQQLDEALAKETPESLNKWLDEENINTNNLCTRCVYAVDNPKICFHSNNIDIMRKATVEEIIEHFKDK